MPSQSAEKVQIVGKVTRDVADKLDALGARYDASRIDTIKRLIVDEHARVFPQRAAYIGVGERKAQAKQDAAMATLIPCCTTQTTHYNRQAFYWHVTPKGDFAWGMATNVKLPLDVPMPERSRGDFEQWKAQHLPPPADALKIETEGYLLVDIDPVTGDEFRDIVDVPVYREDAGLWVQRELAGGRTIFPQLRSHQYQPRPPGYVTPDVPLPDWMD